MLNFARYLPATWIGLAVTSSLVAGLFFKVDISYAFIVATLGMFEIRTGLLDQWSRAKLLARPTGLTIVLWLLSLLLGTIFDLNYVDRQIGALGILLVVGLASLSAILRSRIESRHRDPEGQIL